ncbi:MAG TPA: matrixin family metalloprotease [Polyangiales bacterium]|nr:matrixin family metalloprotease [Polyangiales bacterium]
MFALVWTTMAYMGPMVGSAHAYALKQTKAGQRVRWADSTIALRVDPKLEAALGRERVRAALTMASDAWRGLPGVPSITLSDEAAPGYRAAERTNGVYWMNPWPYPKDQLAVTVSTYAANGRMIGADVLINAEVQYALLDDAADHPDMQQHDLGAVLTHELGHVLGLDESPDDESATMWPYIRSGEVHQRTLSEDDEQGVIEAYAGQAPSSPAGCGQASVVGAARSASADMLWPMLLLPLFLRRRQSPRHRSPQRQDDRTPIDTVKLP